ncbi:hypothetical protein CLM71_06030 [Serratia sp. MYb239]|nr:hypothetical protein CLM71_06030 [Serratia sp. MYb239]
MAKNHTYDINRLHYVLILVNLLISNDFIKKTRIRTMGTEAASALASRRFSKSNTQGYPQE